MLSIRIVFFSRKSNRIGGVLGYFESIRISPKNGHPDKRKTYVFTKSKKEGIFLIQFSSPASLARAVF